ncbi:MAG: putative ABC exporter domain-containing protein [Gemmatimonadota bacterium]
MNGAFWFLTRRSLANRFRRQLARLKEPRYAVALIVGFAYLYFFLFHRPQPGPDGGAPHFQQLVSLLGSLLLLFALLRWWLFAGVQNALTFSPVEIQFLFPAPISRPALIRWKLLRSQVLIMVNALVWIFITRRARPPLPFPVYLISLWILFTTLSLHRLGASLTRAGLSAHWRTGLRRQWIVILIALVAVVALVVPLAGNWPELRDRCCGLDFWTLLGTLLSRFPASAVLFPFHLAMAPMAAHDLAEWGKALLPAAAVLALHYVWVIRSNSAFEEAAVQASAEYAERIARRKSAGAGFVKGKAYRSPLSLTPRGWPGAAIVWKNLISVVRGSLSRTTLIAVLVVGVVFAVSLEGQRRGFAELVGTVGAAVLGFLMIMGHNWIRNDLRQDLAYLALLRSYPLSGRTIMTAEVIGSTLTLTTFQYGFAILAWLGLRSRPDLQHYLTLGTLLLGIPALLLVLNCIVLTLQNAGALLFPSWVRLERVRPGGFETIGQNILTSGFTILLTLVGLVLPAASAMAIYVVIAPTLGRTAATLPAAIAFVAIAAGEILGLLFWMGRVFDRTESI